MTCWNRIASRHKVLVQFQVTISPAGATPALRPIRGFLDPFVGQPFFHEIARAERQRIDPSHLFAIDPVMEDCGTTVNPAVDTSRPELHQEISRCHRSGNGPKAPQERIVPSVNQHGVASGSPPGRKIR